MKKQSSSSGIGFGTILFLVFLTLKLTGFINWSWWWVTAPLWAGFAIFFGVLAIVGIIVSICAVIGLYSQP